MQLELLTHTHTHGMVVHPIVREERSTTLSTNGIKSSTSMHRKEMMHWGGQAAQQCTNPRSFLLFYLFIIIIIIINVLLPAIVSMAHWLVPVPRFFLSFILTWLCSCSYLVLVPVCWYLENMKEVTAYTLHATLPLFILVPTATEVFYILWFMVTMTRTLLLSQEASQMHRRIQLLMVMVWWAS